MSITTPQYLYPAHPYSIRERDRGSVKVGLLWQGQSSDQIWTGVYANYEVWSVDIIIDRDVNNSRATAVWVPFFVFPNGLECCIIGWYDAGQDPAGYYLTSGIRYNGTELTEAQLTTLGLSHFNDITLNCSQSGGVGSLPINYEIVTNTAVKYTAYFYIACKYYPAVPVENVTPANSIQFMMNMAYLPGAGETRPVPTESTLYGGNYRDVSRQTVGWWATLTTAEDTAPFAMVNLDDINNKLHTVGDPFDGQAIRTETTPDSEDDPSGTGGGGGSYDPTSDPVDFPTKPTGGALTSGMIKGFVIGSANLVLFQNKLWDMSLFDIATQYQKLLNQPLDCLVSLHALPVLPTTGSPQHVKLGSFDTEVSANVITDQYVEVNCGSLTLPEYYGSALDYGPYTRCEIFLPFIGFRDLIIDDVNKMTITLKYYVDVLTGSCVAFIKCGQSVLYSFTGSCIQHIPVSATSSDLLKNNISAIGPVAVGIAAGNPASVAAGAMAGAINTASSKNHVSRTGDLAGSAGIMGEFTPYMVFHRPRQSLARNYNKFKGYPSNITYTLSSLSGYTEVEHVHLTGIRATDTELEEIENKLKEGVII